VKTPAIAVSINVKIDQNFNAKNKANVNRHYERTSSVMTFLRLAGYVSAIKISVIPSW
jgi:hypothetical protein